MAERQPWETSLRDGWEVMGTLSKQFMAMSSGNPGIIGSCLGVIADIAIAIAIVVG